MKPKLKPPGTKHLNLKCDILLSTFAFKFKLRYYTVGLEAPGSTESAYVFRWTPKVAGKLITTVSVAGAYTRPLLSST
jgi:hypothetical protein